MRVIKNKAAWDPHVNDATTLKSLCMGGGVWWTNTSFKCGSKNIQMLPYFYTWKHLCYACGQ